MTALFEIAFGVVLGFSLAAPPGPMNALIAARSVGSFRAGFLTGLGAFSADLLLGLIVYLVQHELDVELVIRYVYVLGCGVMLFFAYRLFTRPPPVEESAGSRLSAYSSALGVGLSNPFQILWWLTAGLAFAYIGGAVLFVGLFGAILVWVVGFPLVVHAGVQRYPRLRQYVGWVSGALMVAFGVYFAILAA